MKGWSLKIITGTSLCHYSVPSTLLANFPLPRFSRDQVKVTTFSPEWGCVCSGGPLRTAVIWAC